MGAVGPLSYSCGMQPNPNKAFTCFYDNKHIAFVLVLFQTPCVKKKERTPELAACRNREAVCFRDVQISLAGVVHSRTSASSVSTSTKEVTCRPDLSGASGGSGHSR